MPETWNLVGDIGGTHVRLALCRDARHLEKISVMPSADFDGIETAVRHYLESACHPDIGRAAIGMANPVTGDHIKMTNLPWSFSIEATRKTLGLQGLHIINDFTALALSLPQLMPADLRQVGGQKAVGNTPMGVVGPGTGLGVSGLIPGPGGSWIPLAGEGGHVNFAPASEPELALWNEARQHHSHVSMERLVSGAGLEFIYQTYSHMAGKAADNLTPADISSRAISASCPISRQALDTFCAILGTVASDIALTLGARGGMYIGGGIVPKLGNYFVDSPFRARFETKGRFSEYLAAIPVFVINSRYPGLTGAAAYLENTAASPA